MPISDSPTRWTWRGFHRDRSGATAAEFALLVPMLMLALGAIVELGSFFQQQAAVEKGVRSAAMYAARSSLPLNNASRAVITNIAKTGQRSGGSNLVPGWADGSATLDIDVNDVTNGGVTVSVIRLSASVPYRPVVPVIDELAVLQGLTLSAAHEQGHIGG